MNMCLNKGFQGTKKISCPTVPLSRDKKKFPCPAVPLFLDKSSSKNPGTNSSVPGCPGTKSFSQKEQKQKKDVLKQEQDVLKQEIIGKK